MLRAVLAAAPAPEQAGAAGAGTGRGQAPTEGEGGEGKGSEGLTGSAVAPTVVPGPLHMACHGGHVAAVQLLLGLGHDASAADSALDTALHVACRMGHGEVAQLLLGSASGQRAAGLRNARGQLPAEQAAPGSAVEKALQGKE